MRKLAIALALSTAFAAMPALADDFSFTGTFQNDNDKVFFDFTADGASTITLISYSYAGGTNQAGDVIARGGFDPILSLYDLATGSLIQTVDDGPLSVPDDAVTGAPFDTHFEQVIAAGNYRVYVTQYDNFGPASLLDPFPQDGNPNFRNGFVDATGDKRDGHWAFDILGVESATQGGVPEPATWAMMIGGFGLVGGAMRRRSTKVAIAA